MAQLGWTTVADLQAVSERELAARFGRFGHRLAQFVKGEDDRPVKASRVAKSISAETTFSVNLWRADELARALEPLCERVARNLKAKKIAGRTVTLKLKTGDFRIITRRVTFKNPTQSAAIIFAAAERLLRAEADGRNFRLIGAGMSDFCPDTEADLPDLFELMTASK
jgi:DNA polymerase-4